MFCRRQWCPGWASVGLSIQGSTCTCGDLHVAQESDDDVHKRNIVGDAWADLPSSFVR